MTKDKFNLSQRLKEVRLFRGYTTAEHTACFLKIGRSQYTKYEAGENMGMRTLFKILDSWGLSENVFFSGKQFKEDDFTESCPDHLKEIALFVLESFDSSKSGNRNVIRILRPVTPFLGNEVEFGNYYYLRTIKSFNDWIAEKQIINEVKRLNTKITATKIIVEK